jgi:oxygen-dependent protoporphyrinogen oxidase
LSLRATFPQFIVMEEKYGSVLVGLKKRDEATQLASGARYSLFTTLKGGMQTLVDRLEATLVDGSIRRRISVRGLEKRKTGWVLTLSNGDTLEAERLCLALPAYQCADLLRETDPILAQKLDTIAYSGSATLNVGFKETDIAHPLDGFGFVTPFAENRTGLACTFVHRKFAGRAPAGHALLRVFVGGALQEELLGRDDGELERRVMKDLSDLLGIRTPPLFSQLTRWPRAMPQYTLGHVQRVLQIEEALLRHKGLALAGNWLRGVGIPDCIEAGRRAAETLLASC